MNALEGVLLALGAFFFLGTGLRQATIAVDTGHAGATDSPIGPLALAALPIALAWSSFALRAWLRGRRRRAQDGADARWDRARGPGRGPGHDAPDRGGPAPR